MDDDEEPTIRIVTPQFEREDGVSPDNPPADLESFQALRQKTEDELLEMGLRKWDEETGLMLFPHEWYDAIPRGLEVTDIFGETETFDPDESSNDKRRGVLAYGIVPEA